MEIDDVRQLVRLAYRKAIRGSSLARIERYRKSSSCPFRFRKRCLNPLNPSRECTEEPKDCPYLYKVLMNTHPMPALFVPIKAMMDRGLIRLYVDTEKRTLYVKPLDQKSKLYASRAAALLEMAMQIYSNEPRNVEIVR